jgi:hypothetical protein
LSAFGHETRWNRASHTALRRGNLDGMESKCAFDPVGDDQLGNTPEANASRDQKTLDDLFARWQQSHDDRTREIETALEVGGSTPDERFLSAVAAHELALAESLAKAQVGLAGRVCALLDNTKVATQLARALAEVTACRNASTRRAEEVLQAAGTLRAQRRLANLPPIRRVA